MIAGNQYRTAYNASNVPDKAINFGTSSEQS
jgi:hypothetical protein